MVISSRRTVIAAVAAAAVLAPGADAFSSGFMAPMSGMPRAVSHAARAQAPATGPRMVAAPERNVLPHRRHTQPLQPPAGEAPLTSSPSVWQPATWFSPGQFVGPQAPGQMPDMELPYDNFNLVKNKPEAIKQHSGHLRFPLLQACAPR